MFKLFSFRPATELVRARMDVNRIQGFLQPARYDGVVLHVDGPNALVRWPNGDRTYEAVSQLCPIVA